MLPFLPSASTSVALYVVPVPYPDNLTSPHRANPICLVLTAPAAVYPYGITTSQPLCMLTPVCLPNRLGHLEGVPPLPTPRRSPAPARRTQRQDPSSLVFEDETPTCSYVHAHLLLYTHIAIYPYCYIPILLYTHMAIYPYSHNCIFIALHLRRPVVLYVYMPVCLDVPM